MRVFHATCCPFCKGDIVQLDDVCCCQGCQRGFSPHEMQQLLTTGKLEDPVPLKKSSAVGRIILWVISGLTIAAVTCVAISWMLMLLISPIIIAVVREHCKKIIAATKIQPLKPYHGPETVEDYIAVFRNIQRSAPACTYAGEAAYQLRQFRSQQDVLHFLMGGEEHPFLDAERNAEVYMLANCRRLYVRLRCSDLRTVNNADYEADFQQCLTENAVLLRDFERLTVEVSQMNEALPQNAPALDVLADTLRDIRTGEIPEPPRRMVS